MKHAFTRQSIANSKMQTNMHTSWNSQCNPDMQCSNTWTMETSHDCKSNTKSIILIIYINNRLFMAPHLVRAQSAYKDQDSLISSHTHRCMCAHTLSHTHTRTQYKFIHYWWWLVQWEENDRSVCRREEVGYQFSLKKRVKTNAWQREEESSRSQVRCVVRISSPGSFCPS